MKYSPLLILLLWGCVAFSQQSSSPEQIIKQLQHIEILPVKKAGRHYPVFFTNSHTSKIINYTTPLPPSPFNDLYMGPEDDQALSNLAGSVKIYMTNLKNKKPSSNNKRRSLKG